MSSESEIMFVKKTTKKIGELIFYAGSALEKGDTKVAAKALSSAGRDLDALGDHLAKAFELLKLGK